jgi:RNA polymerase sigma factor (TIGR02999 family)
MSDLTVILQAIESGDPLATNQLLPVVYQELRALASVHLRAEQPGQTLQPTALVHEAYLRLVGGANPLQWKSRSHFFAAAAQAMRRILIDQARHKQSLKGGGNRQRQELHESLAIVPEPIEDLLALDEALDRLRLVDAAAAELVQLRYFAGLTVEECAEVLEISVRTAGHRWSYARAWLRDAIEKPA